MRRTIALGLLLYVLLTLGFLLGVTQPYNHECIVVCLATMVRAILGI